MSDDSVDCHTLSRVASVCACFLMYSGLKVGSLHLRNHGYQQQMKSRFIAPPASSISLQRNEMVMAYKTPVERLKKGLAHGRVQTVQ